MEMGQALRDQDMELEDLGKSSASSWVSSCTRPFQPCPSHLFRPPPAASFHHLATDCAPQLDIGGLEEWCPTTAFSPLPGCSLPLLWPWGFYLQQSPSFLSTFFFNILILLWGWGLSNEQDHF